MLARVPVLPLALVLVACRTTADEPVPRTTAGAPAAVEVAQGSPDPIAHETQHAAITAQAAAQPTSRVSSTPYKPPATLAEPIAIYRATLPRPIFTEPKTGTPLRGRVEMGESFHVYALREGEDRDGCSRPWAQVGEAAWVCTKHAEPDARGKPRVLPQLLGTTLLPFLYARHVRHEDHSTPKLPVYRHLTALRSDAEPIDWLAAYGTYAFVRRTRSGRQSVLIDIRGRVVPADNLKTFEPSEFGGRDLVAAPVPDDRALAWVTQRKSGLYTRPDLEAEFTPLDLYTELLIFPADAKAPQADADAPQADADAQPANWIRVPASRPGESGSIAHEGWIPAAHIREWRPMAQPEPVLAGQRLIDVDLDQQTLTLWHEDQAIFATLVASGKPGYATPLGLYRIITKRAFGKMASLPKTGDPYWVDAVPWTMYFDGRFALHAAFWHDRFGHRTSHGCVNLSPRDAKYVFEASTPDLPLGWLIVNEHASDPGTLVRIHKGSADVPDRRGAALEAAALDD